MLPLGPDDPTTIGQYRLLGVLGVGGMGRVYLGRTSGGRTVAVKVVRPDLAGDTEFRTRFRREVAAARRVAGPYTVPVLDADVDAHRPWLATGFVSGLALSDAVDNHGPLPEPSLLTLAAGLARALTDVHATGLVHRDLKPSNVLLAIDGPRVIDFGIARAAEDTALTTTGKIIGSPGYMCPEQITGTAPVGPPADVFALGGLLVYAATGTGPFGTGDTVPMLWRVVQEEPRLDGVPDTLRPLVAACLAKDPAARPTPAQLVQHLAATDRPDTRGWLPGPILEDISRRTVALLDLETAALPEGQPQTANTLLSPPHPPSAQHWTPTATAIPHNPHTPPPTPAPAPRSKRPLAYAAIAVVILALVGTVSGILAYQSNSGGGSGAAAAGTSTQRPSRTADTSQSGKPSETGKPSDGGNSSAALPKSYVDTWKGTVTDGLATFDVVVSLKAGKIGEELGTASNTGRTSHQTCKRAETLTAVDADKITLRARLTEGNRTPGLGCDDDGKMSTLELNRDGTITYSMTGPLSQLTGILRRK
ncbi:serine/threonine protein kinase [Nocardia transvalensis]|uniref:Serine/threonine protein kinase n=1 Tax=Nocardia transvalensis TaxID=37333 RepID=A0A7W9PJ80_9NOCA|nr:serine/threonine-protein kinase [Nocardia transvalensis]MBB5916478.1 serine/threonine protein kinase [Nocardia transvalensis]